MNDEALREQAIQFAEVYGTAITLGENAEDILDEFMHLIAEREREARVSEVRRFVKKLDIYGPQYTTTAARITEIAGERIAALTHKSKEQK